LNPDLMRVIDYWVGIPLLFLLTQVSRVQRFFGLATSPIGRPRNILFIQLAEMGTMVVAYPALKKTRELYPDATLHFLCFTQIRSSVEMLEIIPTENIITSTRIPRCRSRATRCVFCGMPAVAASTLSSTWKRSSGTAAC
jgi:hypothetical protein